jgi:hypothetical protein
MNTCKTCKFWGRYRVGACDAADLVDKGDKVTGNELAVLVYAADDQGLEGHLMTGPDFGCVKHQGVLAHEGVEL